MKRFLLLLTLAALTWGLTAQIHRSFEPPTRHGRGLATALGLPTNPTALYTFGPDPTLVPGARWFWVGWNLLRWSETFDNNYWATSGASISADATLAPDGTNTADLIVEDTTTPTDYDGHGVYHKLETSGLADDTIYAASVYVKAGGRSWCGLELNPKTRPRTNANSAYLFVNLSTGTIGQTGAGGVSYNVSAAPNGFYRVSFSVDARSGGYAQRFRVFATTGDGVWTYEGDGSSAIYIWGAQLEVGTSPTAYQKTEAQQTFHDWSGNGNTAVRGNSENEDTNDPQLVPSSRNLLAPGSTEDLEDSNWTATDANTTATTFTPTAQNAQVVQSFTTTDGAHYVLSATISSAGNTSLQWVKGGSTANLTVTATPTRYSTTFTGDGNAWNLGLRDPNSSGFGAITFTDIQLETGATATAYTNPAKESLVQGATFDGVDDYVALPDESALKPDAFTVIAVLRMHDATDGEPVISWSSANSRPAVYARSPDDWGNQSKPLIYLNSENYCYFAETIETETWHVLAVTVPGSGQTDIEEAAFYLDGTPLTIDTAYSADSQMSKGQPWLGRAGDYYGHMDQALIAVYSRAIRTGETQRAYRSIARLYWDYRSICVSGWESHCQSPPLHTKLLAPWQPDGTWALAMLPRKLGLVPVWREVQ